MDSKTDIKAAFFDIDGTLVSFNTHKVSLLTIRALEALHNKGIKIIMATGRSTSNLDAVEMLPYDGVIALNGTDITLRNGISISRHSIPTNVFLRFCELAGKFNAAVSIECDKGIFVNKITPRVEEMVRLVALPLPTVVDLNSVFIEGQTSQLCLYADKEVEHIIMSQLPQLTSSRWCDAMADVNLSGYDKGFGLKEISDYWGIQTAETISFGDGGNDIPLIKTAGIGIAMGNAREILKEHADYITLSVDEEGIDYALRFWGLI